MLFFNVDLTDIRARVAAATPGPWVARGSDVLPCREPGAFPLPILVAEGDNEAQRHADALFVADARDDIETLCLCAELAVKERELHLATIRQLEARASAPGPAVAALIAEARAFCASVVLISGPKGEPGIPKLVRLLADALEAR